MESFIAFAQDYRDFFVMLHLLAMVLGLGGATYSDILLMKFLNDFKISKKEAEVIETMAKVLLIGIILAFASGFMLFWSDWTRLIESEKFLAKTYIFSIIILNGYLLHKLVLPKLIHFTFHKEKYLIKKFHLRQAGFLCGAISVVSWYSVFLLGSFREVSLGFLQILGIYGAFLAIAMTSALMLEMMIKKRTENSLKK